MAGAETQPGMTDAQWREDIGLNMRGMRENANSKLDTLICAVVFAILLIAGDIAISLKCSC